ncbi:MAG: cupin domain-containing protein [Zetaproteobacteria bacterium]|nr:cupin domain-containing protein [Zetaproteobacteria bacterium]
MTKELSKLSVQAEWERVVEGDFIYYVTSWGVAHTGFLNLRHMCGDPAVYECEVKAFFAGWQEVFLSEVARDSAYEVTFATLAQGVQVAPHQHEVSVLNVVQQGVVQVCLGETQRLIEPGEAIYIPRGVSHTLQVVQDAEILEVWEIP